MILIGPHEREMLALRRRNTVACIGSLRDRGVQTLTEIARATGLSRPTVESIVAELVVEGLVAEESESAPASGSSKAGRPARQFAFVADAAHVVSVDLGLHRVTVLVSDLSGTIVTALVRDTPATFDGGILIELMHEALQEAIAPLGISEFQLASVVVCVTGIVDDRGRMLQSNLVPDWNGIDLAAQFGRGLSAPVTIENDVNMAAVAELHTGAARLADDVVFVMVGHRINAAIILGGALHRGRNFAAGEVGDLAVTGWGYEGIREGSVLSLFSGRSAADVFTRAEAGDAESIELVGRFSRQIAQGVAAVGLALDPDLIVIGGGLSEAGDLLLDNLRLAFNGLVKRHMQLPLVASTIGSAGVAVGGLVRALERASEELYGAADLGVPKLTVAGGAKADSFRMQLSALTATSQAPLSPAQSAAEPTQESAHLATVDDDLRVALVGVGMRGAIARHADRPGHGSRIVVAVDTDPAGAARAKTLLGRDVPFSTDHRTLDRSAVDAAIVVTPDHTHFAIAADLLRAGIPVYLDKPIAISTEDADTLLAIAHETGTKLYVGHNMRHMSVVRLMRDIISRGEIGEVKAVWCRHFVGNGGDYYFKDWHADRTASNGLLLQKGSHDLDIIHWLAGSASSEVVGMGALSVYGDITDRRDRSGELMQDWFSMDNWPPASQTGLNPVIDVEDQSMVLMRLESGVLASYEQCHFTPDYWRNYTVIGTEGRLENFGDGDGGVVRVWNHRVAYQPEGDRSYAIIGDTDGHGDADANTMREFIDFVRFDAPTDTSPIGARNAVAAASAATHSLRNGSVPERIPPVDPAIEAYFADNQSRSERSELADRDIHTKAQ